MSIQPYCFEPTRLVSSDDDDGWEDVSDGDIAQQQNEDVEVNDLVAQLAATRFTKPVAEWCQCNNCKTMPSSRECLCCKELAETKAFGGKS